MESILRDLTGLQIQDNQSNTTKTFQRRAKGKATAIIPEDEAIQQPSPILGTPASPDAASPGAYGWLGSNLSRSRRSSILPQPRPVADGKPVRNRLTKAQRLAYKQFIKDMVLHFSEVDAFELIEESPACKAPASPEQAINEQAAALAAAESPSIITSDLAASESDVEDDADDVSDADAAEPSPPHPTRRSSLAADTPATQQHVHSRTSRHRRESASSHGSITPAASVAEAAAPSRSSRGAASAAQPADSTARKPAAATPAASATSGARPASRGTAGMGSTGARTRQSVRLSSGSSIASTPAASAGPSDSAEQDIPADAEQLSLLATPATAAPASQRTTAAGRKAAAQAAADADAGATPAAPELADDASPAPDVTPAVPAVSQDAAATAPAPASATAAAEGTPETGHRGEDDGGEPGKAPSSAGSTGGHAGVVKLARASLQAPRASLAEARLSLPAQRLSVVGGQLPLAGPGRAGRKSSLLPGRMSLAAAGAAPAELLQQQRRQSRRSHMLPAEHQQQQQQELQELHTEAPVLEGDEEAGDDLAASPGAPTPAAARTPRRSSMAGVLARLRRDSAARMSLAAAVRRSSLPGLDELQEAELLDLLASEGEDSEEEEQEEEEGKGGAGPANSAASEGTQVACAEEQEEVQQEAAEQEEVLEPLQKLLKICGQELDAALAPDMDSLLRPLCDLRRIVKIGEGTYGEAFKGGSLVFKVIPMEGDTWINEAAQKRAGDMMGEAVIALTLSGLRKGTPQFATPGFVHTHKVGICRGPYSPALVRAWRSWDARHTSENDPVDILPREQLYMVIAMEDCGRDLEGAQVQGFRQGRSLLLQVALTLAVAEEACAFEHRDLHWGNVLLKPADSTTVRCTYRGMQVEMQTEGIIATLIDFTASRLNTIAGDVAFCDLAADPEIFEGPKGECQFDTYRKMRKLTKDDWSGSYLATNCVWLAYLADTLLTKKALALSSGEKRQLQAFRRRAAGYTCCGELIWDELFQGAWLAE